MCAPITFPLSTPALAIDIRLLGSLFLLVFILILLLALVGTTMLTRGDPGVAIALHGLVLVGEVDALALTVFGGVGLPPLGEGAGAGRELGADAGVRADPVGQRVLAVLDDGLGGLVAVIGVASLAGGDGRVVDELEKMLAVPGDDGQFLAVLTHRVELVRECRLEFLARDVAQLGFGHEGLGLGAHEFLFQHHDARTVGFLVFELGDLVGDFLFAVARGLDRGFDVADRFDGDAILVVAVDELVFQFADLIDQDAELVGYVADVIVAGFAPDGELLLEANNRLGKGWMCYENMGRLTATSILSRPTSSMLRITFFSILTS